MTFEATIQAFFATTTGQLAFWVPVISLADFLFGLAASVRDGTFQLDSIMAFLRKHIMGRVFPIWGLLLVGWIADDVVPLPVDVPLLTGLGAAAAVAYIAETVGSIARAWGPLPAPGTSPGVLTRDPVQPVPED